MMSAASLEPGPLQPSIGGSFERVKMLQELQDLRKGRDFDGMHKYANLLVELVSQKQTIIRWLASEAAQGVRPVTKEHESMASTLCDHYGI